MRHRKSFNHLGRTSSHRKAMLSNMASSLIMHKRINTTLAKAKALRTYVEPLITKAKEDTTHSRRVVFSYLQDKNAVTELFRDVSAKVGERPGGYTRIIKLGNRLGDNADMAMIELVDYNEHLLEEAKKAKTKSTRRRRGGKKKSAADTGAKETPKAATEAKTTEVKEEKPKAEVKTEAKKEEKPEAEVKTEAVKEEKKEAPVEKAEEKPVAAKEEKAAEPKAKETTEAAPEEKKEEKPKVEAKKAEPKEEEAKDETKKQPEKDADEDETKKSE